MTRYTVIINRSVIPWYSQSQKIVTLFVTEAQYSVITELCCEILFVCAISFLMGVVFEYPIRQSRLYAS